MADLRVQLRYVLARLACALHAVAPARLAGPTGRLAVRATLGYLEALGAVAPDLARDGARRVARILGLASTREER